MTPHAPVFVSLRILYIVVSLALLASVQNAHAAPSVYQWETTKWHGHPARVDRVAWASSPCGDAPFDTCDQNHGLEARATQPTDLTPHAYLWIPSDCRRVRAIVIGQHNMIEEGIFDDTVFRDTLAELGFALIWITPSADAVFRFDQGAGARFDAMLHGLAEASGYSEIEYAPIVPIGHSAHASYPWNFGAWKPERTLAMLSLKGDAPLTNMTGSGRPNPDWGARTIDGIPGLMVMGQFEWMPERLAPASVYRAAHPLAPIAALCDVGHGHFDYSPQLIAHLCFFLRKAAFYRLPAKSVSLPHTADAHAPLNFIDPRKGWLVDHWTPTEHPRAPAAAYADYTGDRAKAFWAFDEEHACAIEKTYDIAPALKPQLLGFLAANRTLIPQTWPHTHQQVNLPFRPDADGISFHIEAVFLDTVPRGNPEKWSALPAGSSITRATGGGPITVSRIGGPSIQRTTDTFAIDFSRAAEATSTQPSQDLWFLAAHDGDATHASARQQALMRIPTRNTEGTPQTITFAPIPDQPATTRALTLSATSDSGLPVRYYVRSGPAYIENENTLVFTALPPRSKYPVQITVIAWQYGRATTPCIQTATPVEHTFTLREN